MPLRRPRLERLLGLATASLCAPLLLAQPPAPSSSSAGRVILVSLDGMGTRLFLEDPVADQLHALAALRARGAMASGLVTHMPSTTANSHAALWTGAWGDVNGITSNEMPLAPRSEHAAIARVSGYQSDGLRAEPLWVAAARQGVPVVAQQASQIYPLSPRTTGGPLARPPILLHGYQAPVVAPARWLRASDLTRQPCGAADQTGAVTCLAWSAGPIRFRASLVVPAGGPTTLHVRVDGAGPGVTVPLVPAEHEPPAGRELARHFSEGLLVDIPDVPPVMAYFRLFDASADGRSLVLFQSALQETVLYTGRRATREETITFLREAGGFVGNGKTDPWDEKAGTSPAAVTTEETGAQPLYLGGDGTRERRYLETLELGIRQTIRQAGALWRRHQPRLLVGYVSMPDELDHQWLGHAQRDARYAPLRRWGYQLVDRAVATYVDLASPDDYVIFASDHGMSPVTHEVRVNQALAAAGLVVAGRGTAVDGRRSQVLFGRNCLLVHTADWKDGIVPVTERDAVLDKAVGALQAIRAPGDDQPIITSVLRSSSERERYGFGGPNGFDACVDFRPGYMASTSMGDGPLVRARSRPTGEHGFLPTRPDMQGILIAAGPRVPRGATWPQQRAIDVAPLVSDLLGIEPPRDARGVSPLRW
jgi:predicted AlkP superfamily phosphohydrolase/phosphomutase